MTEAAYASVWTRAPDGLRQHARLYGPERFDGLPIVCLPGLTRNSSEFHALASVLLREDPGRRILAVDYRGRGLSDHDPAPARYTIAVETDDLLRLLDEVGIGEASFVGVSRGGLIAMGLGTVRPGLLRALILNDIGPVIEREGLLRIKGYVGRFGLPATLAEGAAQLRTRFGAQFPKLTVSEWLGWAETVWSETEGRLAPSYDPALGRTLDGVDAASPIPDLWPLFDKLRDIPVMVVRGRNSDLLSAETVAEMARHHPGLEAIEVSDEGHTPFLHRPDLALRISRFLDQVGHAASEPRDAPAGTEAIRS